jgi:hypothetical protein
VIEKLMSGCSPTSCSLFFISLVEAGKCPFSGAGQAWVIVGAVLGCIGFSALSVVLWPPAHWEHSQRREKKKKKKKDKPRQDRQK